MVVKLESMEVINLAIVMTPNPTLEIAIGRIAQPINHRDQVAEVAELEMSTNKLSLGMVSPQ
jgi:hypothetical protein